VGTSSLYKRESFPNGVVPKGSVTATWSSDGRSGNRMFNLYQGWDPFNADNETRSWTHQGAEAGRYDNSDIHAIRILAMEATSDDGRGGGNRRFHNHANERLRILGEIPVRKFNGGPEPLDPDGNPDTSFLAKIPADTAFTFQTLDRNGMVLNMAQTWHQVRPGEIRHNCGGCHAHSQEPTLFETTAASRPDYKIFDLTQKTPLLTSKASDESGRQWDAKGEIGLRYDAGVKNVEYHRDIQPILARSCAACHTEKDGNKPPAGLVLDDATPKSVPNGPTVPSTYYRVAMDDAAEYGYKPMVDRWRSTNASRYVRKFQSRRSLLVWKIYGRRLDGWKNEDFPTETVPGDANTLVHEGKPLEPTLANRRLADLDLAGSVMPPPEAVAGKYKGPDGKPVHVAPLSDEDRLTLVRWIDLGCPIDLTYDASQPTDRGLGWMCDDLRPTLAVTAPRAGQNAPLAKIVVGMHDYYTGLDSDSFQVTADFPLAGIAPGENLAPKFKSTGPGVWELPLSEPIKNLASGRLSVAVKDKQGNWTRIDRSFSVNE
jgi:hypothetical protein